jgi:hypothetical protein
MVSFQHTKGDCKKGERPNAKDYLVFTTPTIFLLDNKRKILLRSNSVKQTSVNSA